MVKLTITRFTDPQGNYNLDIQSASGGKAMLTFFGGFKDICSIVWRTPEDFYHHTDICSILDIEECIHDTNKTAWLTDEEKTEIVSFLEDIRKRTEEFLKVKERFAVEHTFETDRVVYSFKEERENAVTLHESVSISVSLPDGSDESSAWRALMSSLNPNTLSDKQFRELISKDQS